MPPSRPPPLLIYWVTFFSFKTVKKLLTMIVTHPTSELLKISDVFILSLNVADVFLTNQKVCPSYNSLPSLSMNCNFDQLSAKQNFSPKRSLKCILFRQEKRISLFFPPHIFMFLFLRLGVSATRSFY